MEHRHAEIVDARNPEKQNRTLMIFTVVTVIFVSRPDHILLARLIRHQSPLAFVTSAFTVAAREWNGISTALPLWKIYELIFSISTGVIVLVVLVRFEENCQEPTQEVIGQ